MPHSAAGGGGGGGKEVILSLENHTRGGKGFERLSTSETKSHNHTITQANLANTMVALIRIHQFNVLFLCRDVSALPRTWNVIHLLLEPHSFCGPVDPYIPVPLPSLYVCALGSVVVAALGVTFDGR